MVINKCLGLNEMQKNALKNYLIYVLQNYETKIVIVT